MTGKSKFPADAYDGDAPDPDKGKQVDEAYSPDYLERRKAFTDDMKARQKGKKRTAKSFHEAFKAHEASRFVETGEGLKITRKTDQPDGGPKRVSIADLLIDKIENGELGDDEDAAA